MYSGTGVCAGQAHWRSTTLWKESGLRMSVGCKTLLLPVGLYPIRILAPLSVRAAAPYTRTRPDRHPRRYRSVAGQACGPDTLPDRCERRNALTGEWRESRLIWERRICSPRAGTISGADVAGTRDRPRQIGPACDAVR